MKKIVICGISVIFLICIIILIFFLRKNNQKIIKNDIVIDNYSINNLWDYSLQNAWYKLEEYLGTEKIFFLDGINEGEGDNLNALNNNRFGKDLISEDYYYVKVSKADKNLLKTIQNDLFYKFNIEKNFDNLDIFNTNGIIIFSYLNKKINFKKDFEEINNKSFIDIEKNQYNINGFGIKDDYSLEKVENIEKIYYKDPYHYGLTLKSIESDEIIIMIPENIKDSFESIFEEYNNNIKEYKTSFKEEDKLFIPNVEISHSIIYEDLCYKYLEANSSEYISCAIHNVDFSLNKKGVILESETLIITDAMSSLPTYVKDYSFTHPFVIFIKEKDKTDPYFAVKIYNKDFLEVKDGNY